MTVVNPLQIKYIDKAGTHAGLAAAGASARKVNALRSTSEFSVIGNVLDDGIRWHSDISQHWQEVSPFESHHIVIELSSYS